MESSKQRARHHVRRFRYSHGWPGPKNGCRRLAVEGPIGVFGPGRGNTRNGPFIMAVLVASPDGRAPPVPMKAFAQPCWSADDILPLVNDPSDPLGTLDLTTHHLPLEQAPHGYELFRNKEDGCIKVVLNP